jgi:hypothetical protein
MGSALLIKWAYFSEKIMIKTITYDDNNPVELKKLIHKLSIRRSRVLKKIGFNGINFNGSRVHADTVLPIFEEIYNLDISSIYQNLDISNTYYVYFHCDPRKKLNIRTDLKHYFLAIKFNLTHVPFYVGKGTGSRWIDFCRNDSHRKICSSILKENLEILSVKISSELTECDALALESKLIDILGLKSLSSNGMLFNLDE